MIDFNDDASLYIVGDPIVFHGYADDFSQGVTGVQFSLDNGCSWTTYPTRGTQADKGISWQFAYTPLQEGTYVLRARVLDGFGIPSPVISNFTFNVVKSSSLPCEYGAFHLRAVGGGPLSQARLFRSSGLDSVTAQDALYICETLKIRLIYDIRSTAEINADPEPLLPHVQTVTLEAGGERRRKDASHRLIAGVIGAYGKPEERMCANYRRYAMEYPIIGTALRGAASLGTSTLVHCVNGKDRTGVLGATAMRIAGFDQDQILEDYLRANEIAHEEIEQQRRTLGRGMTDYELAVLDSFLQARPAYLEAFFEETVHQCGSFDTYVHEAIHLTDDHCAQLRMMLGN